MALPDMDLQSSLCWGLLISKHCSVQYLTALQEVQMILPDLLWQLTQGAAISTLLLSNLSDRIGDISNSLQNFLGILTVCHWLAEYVFKTGLLMTPLLRKVTCVADRFCMAAFHTCNSLLRCRVIISFWHYASSAEISHNIYSIKNSHITWHD